VLTGWVSGVAYTTTYATRIASKVQILQATSGTNTTSYLYGLNQIGEFGLQSVYYLTDGAGSIRHLVDPNGAVKLARMYEPFGQVLMEKGTGDPIYGYLGAQFDRISGLLYINGRYYDPVTGRFLTPSSGGTNPYVPLGGAALAPILILALVGRRKKGKVWTGWIIIALVASAGLTLVACDGKEKENKSTPPTTAAPLPKYTPATPVNNQTATPAASPRVPLPPPPQCPTPPDTPAPITTPTPSYPSTTPTTTSQEGIQFIARFEHLELNLYDDSAGNCTVGYGHLVHLGACDARSSETEFTDGITEQRANDLLAEDLGGTEQAINSLVTVPLTQNQYDALASFVYWSGVGNFYGSDLLTRLNAGKYDAVPEELNRWVLDSSNTRQPGLVTRREQEGALFSNGVYGVGP